MAEYDFSDEQYDFSDFDEPEKDYDFSDFEEAPSPAEDFSAQQRRYDEKILGPLGAVSETIDKYTGAPIRAGIGALQQGKGFGEAASIAGQQFGEDTSGVPSGKDIMSNMGMSTEEFLVPGLVADPTAKTDRERYVQASPAGLAGGVAEAVIDPTMAIGFPFSSGTKSLVRKVGGYAKDVAEKNALNATIGRSSDTVRSYLGMTNKSPSFKQLDAAKTKKAAPLLEGRPYGAKNKVYEHINALREKRNALLESDPNKAVDIDLQISKKLNKKGNPYVTAFATPDKIAAEAGRRLQIMDGEYKALVDELGGVDSKIIDPKYAINDLMKYLDDLPNTDKSEAIRNRVINEMARLENDGPKTFSEMKKWKKQFAWSATDPDLLISNADVSNAINQAAQKSIDKSIQAIAARKFEEGSLGSSALQKYKTLEKEYGIARGIESAAVKRMNRETANRGSSLTDNLWGIGVGVGGAAMSGGDSLAKAAMGLAAAGTAMGVNKLARTYGAGFKASHANRLAKLAKGTNSAFNSKYGKFLDNVVVKGGPPALVLYHNLLMNNDPGYAAYFDEESEPKEQGPNLPTQGEQGFIGPRDQMKMENIPEYGKDIPASKKIKEGLNEWLTANVVEPGAKAGYPDLAAGVATVPSTLADVILPENTGEMAPGMAGVGKLSRQGNVYRKNIIKNINNISLGKLQKVFDDMTKEIPTVIAENGKHSDSHEAILLARRIIRDLIDRKFPGNSTSLDNLLGPLGTADWAKIRVKKHKDVVADVNKSGGNIVRDNQLDAIINTRKYNDIQKIAGSATRIAHDFLFGRSSTPYVPAKRAAQKKALNPKVEKYLQSRGDYDKMLQGRPAGKEYFDDLSRQYYEKMANPEPDMIEEFLRKQREGR